MTQGANAIIRQACSDSTTIAAAPVFPGDVRTVMFLGDSNTDAGHYIDIIEAHFRDQGLALPEFVNLGLPSETCTGLSEPEHPFPRPNVQNRVDLVVDLYTPVANDLVDHRKRDPDFAISPDGVHVNEEGHVVIATAILKAWGCGLPSPEPKTLEMVSKKSRLLHAAWLSHVGHKRPDVEPGLPIEEAKTKAAKIERQIVPK